MSRWARGYLAIYIALFLALVTISVPVFFPSLRYRLSSDEERYLRGVGQLRAQGDWNFPPFSFVRDGVPTGYEPELVTALERVLSVPIVLEQGDWVNVREKLSRGEVDFVTGMRVTEERKQLYSFTRPYLLTSHALVSTRGNALRTLDDVRGRKVAAQSGSSTYERLRSMGYEVIGVPDPETGFVLLARGDVEAWVEHHWVARYYIGSREIDQYYISPLEGTYGNYAIAVSPMADYRLVRILDKALLRLRHEGVFAELDGRWIGPSIQQAVDIENQYTRVVSMVFLVATLGLGLVLNNAYLQKKVAQQTKELTGANMVLNLQQEKLRQMLVNAARAFGVAIEVKDIYTGGHSQRVAKVAHVIAQRLGLEDKECFILYLGALMHDIGKVGVPDYILAKTTGLTDEEYSYVQNHPQIGHSILRNVEGYEDVREIVLYHHERFDGRTDTRHPAYPGRLSGNDIPLGARIVAVADAYDAITSDRPYRKARSIDEALAVLVESAGTQFDPDIVAVMVAARDELLTCDNGDAPNFLHRFSAPPSVLG